MTCPDAETLAQWVEGRLPEFGREALLEHLASCDACREAALVLAPEKRATERRIPARRKGFAWAPWVAAAVALLALGVVWKRLPRREEARPAPETAKAPVPEPPKPVAPAPVEPPPANEKPRPLPEVPKPPPAPEDPAPKPPASEPAPEKPVPAAPTRALAAVRILDLKGRLQSGGADVADGATTADVLTAPDGAGFHVGGHLVVMARGATASIALDGERFVIALSKGEAWIEAHGTMALRLGDAESTLEGAAVLTPAGLRKPEEKERAKFAKLMPARRTLVFEDFASKAAGFESATAQGGPIVGARIAVPAGAAWSKKLALRVRYRTAAKTVQVGMLFKDHVSPWAAMPSAKAGGWQELTVRASDFSAGPTGGAAPADGDPVAWVTFAINTEEPGSSGASLDLDDLSLFLEE